MRVQMVEAQEARPQSQSQALGKGHAHQQTAQQTRTARHAHKINVNGLASATAHQFVEKRPDIAVVLPRGQFRHHSAEQSMHVRLAGKNRGQQSTVFHQSQSRLITGAFNAETKHGSQPPRR